MRLCALHRLPCFQFHKGAIETAAVSIFEFWYLTFNSIKVRLKLECMPVIDASLFTFNSIKVRLKRGGALILSRFVNFQFHKGAIETTTTLPELAI